MADITGSYKKSVTLASYIYFVAFIALQTRRTNLNITFMRSFLEVDFFLFFLYFCFCSFPPFLLDNDDVVSINYFLCIATKDMFKEDTQFKTAMLFLIKKKKKN